MSLKNVPFGELDAFHVVVEVPTGGQKKYEHDHKLDVIKLSRVLYDDAKFPFNYGYIPKTESGDEECLDAFVLSTHPISRGTVVVCRAVGIIEVIDRGQEDHKILAVPLHEPRLENIKDLADLPASYIPSFEEFFKRLAEQWHQDIAIKGFFGRDRAKKELLRTQILD